MQTDTTYTPSLVHIAADGTTKLGEIVLPSSVRAVQGLAVDEAGGRLFYASLSERLIRIVSYSGAQIGTMTLPAGIAPNALTYDPTLNALVVGLSTGSPNNNIVQWRSLADNTVIKELNVGVNPDHLFLDTSKGTAGTLYVSYGESNGHRLHRRVRRRDRGTDRRLEASGSRRDRRHLDRRYDDLGRQRRLLPSRRSAEEPDSVVCDRPGERLSARQVRHHRRTRHRPCPP